MELCRAMSVAGFSDGCDSDCSPPPGGSDDGDNPGARILQRRMREFDNMSDCSDDTTTDTIDSPRPSPRSPCALQRLASPPPIAQQGHRPVKHRKTNVSCSL